MEIDENLRRKPNQPSFHDNQIQMDEVLNY